MTHPDVNAFRDYLRSQFSTLIGRHPVEHAVLVKVLCEEHQRAAGLAKRGRSQDAAAAIAELESRITLPDDSELREAVRTVSLPATALVEWVNGNDDAALAMLHLALDDCASLARRDHGYLTGRQLHLALNVARLLVVQDPAASQSLLDRTELVADGDVSAWPFGGADRLVVPLRHFDDIAVRTQLAGVRARLARTPPLGTR